MGGRNESPMAEETDDDGFIVHNSETPLSERKNNNGENTPVDMRAVYMHSLLSPSPIFHGAQPAGKALKCYVCRFAQEPLIKCSRCDRRYHAECVGLRADERTEDSCCAHCERAAAAAGPARENGGGIVTDAVEGSDRGGKSSARSRQGRGSGQSPLDCSDPCLTLPGAGLRGYRVLSDDDIDSAEKARRSGSIGTQRLPLSGSIRPPLPIQPDTHPAAGPQRGVDLPREDPAPADAAGPGDAHPDAADPLERVEFQYVEPIEEDYGMEIDF